jgi:thioredoxin 1
MTDLIEDIKPNQFDALIASEQRGVVLLFWAPWHLGSDELREEAERLALAHADEMVLVMVNIDRELELAMRYGLRAVPLMILFQHGEEVARTSGASGYEKMAPWLWCHGIALASMPAGFELPHHALRGAFHGDVGLRQELIERLRERGRTGAIVSRRVPFWLDGRGTISGALADSVRPDLLEARSGLPFSFACALEFLGLEWSEATIDAVFGEIRAGADLTMVAIILVRDVLADPEKDWALLIGDAQIDQWRQQWVRLIDRHTCGFAVAQNEWSEVVVGLGMLRSRGRDPARAVQDAFIDMLGLLSPPPAHDDDLWVSALSLHGIYLLHVILAHDLGWRTEDFAFEGERGQWFMAREKSQPDGRFSEQALAQAQQEWMAERGDDQRFYDRLLAESSEQFPLLSHRNCQRLLRLLRESAARL